MATGEPVALLAAIAERAQAGDLKEIKVFSLFPMEHAAWTILAPNLAIAFRRIAGS